MFKDLASFLSGFTRLAVIGIGSDIRGDDGIGIYVTDRLKKHNRDPRIDILFGGITPENLTGKLKRSRPSHVLMIDAFHDRNAVSDIMLLDPAAADGLDFSTHAFSLGTLAKYIEAEIGSKVMVLGIKAGDLRFGEKISGAVVESGKKVIKYFRTTVFSS